MNSSVMATEILKLFSFLLSFFAVMKSRISGWSTLRIAMLAPRLVPPCFTVSVAASNTVMNEIGPLEIPLVVLTRSFLGRMREKENPVPPPLLWISAVFLIVSKMLSIESSIGRTKHAESCWSSPPAFINVGELGRKSRVAIIL